MTPTRLTAVIGLLAAAAFHVAPASSADCVVFAAASLSDALKEIGGAYEKASGVHVSFNFGASSTLALQIQEGAPADVFFSADEAKMNALAQRRLILPDTRRSMLSNTLVVVVPADAPVRLTRIDDLSAPRFKAIAIADPLTVPAGVYARQYLRATRLWNRLADRLIPTDNVRAALAAVEAGNADAGIVYRTDALISKKVAIAYEVPVTQGPRISYPVAVVSGTPHKAAARAFVRYLASRPSLDVFRKYGFRLNAVR